MFVRHQVEDYGAFRAVYDSVESLRQEYGVTGEAITVDPENKQDVFVIHQFASLEQAHAFAASQGLRQAMHQAGLAGPPRIEFSVEA